MPSLPATAMDSMDNEEPIRSQSPAPSSCASDDGRQEELEHLGVADTVLADDNWRWLCELLDPVHDAAVRSQAKVFFARLLKTQDGAGMDATLTDMEAWRGQLGDDREQEQALARALFLLGYDKSLALANE